MQSIDIDDIEQALEIACGDSLGGEFTGRHAASAQMIAKLRGRVKRFLAEIPGDISVSELVEIMEGQDNAEA